MKRKKILLYIFYENQTLEIYTIYDTDIGEMKFPIAKAKRINPQVYGKFIVREDI